MSFARTGILVLSLVILAACAHRVPPLSRTDSLCKDASFPIYFERGSDQLTAAAVEVIKSMGAQYSVCKMASEVVGLADAGGAGEAAKVELTRHRAFSVARALTAAGLPTPVTEVGAGTGSVRGRALPLSGRAEIILHVTSR